MHQVTPVTTFGRTLRHSDFANKRIIIQLGYYPIGEKSWQRWRASSFTTDAMGTLAGRLKRRWLRERREDDGTRAMELYRQAYGLSENSDPAQAYYHGINIAFMNLVFNRSLPDAQIWARHAHEHCSAAAKTEIAPDAWRLATQGEANLLIGDVPSALRLYREAIATQPDPWQLESMYLQALETARQLRSKQVAGNLAQTFNKRLA